MATEPAVPIEPLLTRRDVMLIFGVNEPTLNRWVERGVLRKIKPGGRTSRVMFKRSDVQRLIDGMPAAEDDQS